MQLFKVSGAWQVAVQNLNSVRRGKNIMYSIGLTRTAKAG
jgi:hypothetical protein